MKDILAILQGAQDSNNAEAWDALRGRVIGIARRFSSRVREDVRESWPEWLVQYLWLRCRKRSKVGVSYILMRVESVPADQQERVFAGSLVYFIKSNALYQFLREHFPKRERVQQDMPGRADSPQYDGGGDSASTPVGLQSEPAAPMSKSASEAELKKEDLPWGEGESFGDGRAGTGYSRLRSEDPWGDIEDPWATFIQHLDLTVPMQTALKLFSELDDEDRVPFRLRCYPQVGVLEIRDVAYIRSRQAGLPESEQVCPVAQTDEELLDWLRVRLNGFREKTEIPYRFVGELLGMEENGVNQRVLRARKKLRAGLQVRERGGTL